MPVSIIIKTLNEERRIAAALTSALAALPDGVGEVIVADSGSGDRTVEIARGYPVRIAQLVAPARPSCGIGPQLGFQYARYEYVCLIDGDMELAPEFLAEALAFLEAHPEHAGVTGHVVEKAVENLEFARRVQRVSPEKRVGELDRMNGGGVYRREAIESAGYFSDRNLHAYEEYDLGVRLRMAGWKLHRLDRPFVYHYGHTSNAYGLLARRWRSRYAHAAGELLRAAIGKPHFRLVLAELRELRLWALVYVWWLALIAVAVMVPDKGLAAGIDIALVVAVFGAMAVKSRSLSSGIYAVVAWIVYAAALPLGFLHPRRAPEQWVESQVLAEPA